MDFTIKRIDAARFNDINIPNEPFSIIGKLYPEYNGTWNYHVSLYPNEQRYEMTFPNEHYDYALLSSDSFFVGAYTENEACIGLAIFQKSCNKYLYLYVLIVLGDFYSPQGNWCFVTAVYLPLLSVYR